MNTYQSFENVEEIIKEAEDSFRKGIATLNSWSEQAREVIENRPEIILAAIGVSGIIAGALLRHGVSMRKAGRLPANPILFSVSSFVAGAIAGPKVVQEVVANIERIHLRENSILNEKPFERY